MVNTKLATIIIAIGMAASFAALFSQKASTTSQIPASVQGAFTKWIAKHKKAYSSPSELAYRLSVFHLNTKEVARVNALGESTAGINKFSDLTKVEFKAKYLGMLQPDDSQTLEEHLPLGAAPASVDWRDVTGVVSPIKDQGQCGSCWAFSTIESLESLYVIAKKGSLTELSVEQLKDCSWFYGNEGCNGGLMTRAFMYIKRSGIESKADYGPYHASNRLCKHDKSKNHEPKISGHVRVPKDNGEALEAAVAEWPVSIGVDAESWQNYTGGIIGKGCGVSVDHGVVVLGYGTNDEGKDYWIVRNSWGTDWGLSGYIHLAKSTKKGPGACAINTNASYAKF